MIANWNYSRFFVCRHEIFLYSISKISFPPFGNRWHITRTKINRQIFKYKCLLRSASKLKRGVIEGTGGCFWFSVFVDFSSPIFFVGFFAVNFDGDIVRESFSVKFILHSLWYTPLVYVFMNLFFFNVVFCVCSLLIFFSLNPMSILHELLDTYIVQLLTK